MLTDRIQKIKLNATIPNNKTDKPYSSMNITTKNISLGGSRNR